MDQVFGQLAAIIARHSWDDPDGLVDILSRVCRNARGSSRASCTKLDQVGEWKNWFSHLQAQIKGMHDIHWLKFCRREDLGVAAQAPIEMDDFPMNTPRSGGDIMIVVKQWMADKDPLQVIAFLPEGDIPELLGRQPPQPAGDVGRRPISSKVKKNIVSNAPKCRAAGFISETAEAYLLGWCDGTLPQLTRPARLHFLEHCWQGTQAVGHQPLAVPLVAAARAPRPLRVVRARRPRAAPAVPGVEAPPAGAPEDQGSDGEEGPVEFEDT